MNCEKDFIEGCRQYDKQNFKAAFELYKSAVDAGCSDAEHNLAHCYAHGLGTRRNREAALKLYRRSYRNGNAHSAHNIGLTYLEEGKRSQARQWFMRAVKAGELDSALDLAKLWLSNGTRDGEKKARTYLNQILRAPKATITEDCYEEAAELLNEINSAS